MYPVYKPVIKKKYVCVCVCKEKRERRRVDNILCKRIRCNFPRLKSFQMSELFEPD